MALGRWPEREVGVKEYSTRRCFSRKLARETVRYAPESECCSSREQNVGAHNLLSIEKDYMLGILVAQYNT
jgi:hypothetical protein